MIINSKTLLDMAPIVDMATEKHWDHGVSYGLGEAGYDIRIKQDIRFFAPNKGVGPKVSILEPDKDYPALKAGRFCIASAIEEFRMPEILTGIVLDKSTWARHGLSVFNTVIEPGWHGFLTLELVYHGDEDLHIPAGSGIAQVIFHRTVNASAYDGKYQNQKDEPVAPIMEYRKLLEPELGPVCIIDEKGVHPERLDPIVKAQQKQLCPIYSEDDCHRREDCGPACRNKN